MKWFRRQEEPTTEVSEQREFERIRMILGVVCRQRGEDFNIFTDDVSVGGMRFVSQHPVYVNEEVTLFVVLSPESKPVSMHGHVVWLNTEGERQFVGGLQFNELSPEIEKRWAEFIQRNRSDSET
ncbi:MAG: PilZ domain-containing protein [Armatimonadetes bacterium]|nr:PilZ domain-containing protein [Armatimonadota bacterium]